jgi:hypothetical protein
MPVKQRQSSGHNPAGRAVLAVVVVFLFVALSRMPVHAQETESDLSIGGIEHTVVDGQHVIVAMLNNASAVEIQATGTLSIIDAGGLQIVHTEVTTGPLVPDGASVLAVPLPRALPDGRYSLTLMLYVDPDEPPVQYGLRRFMVEIDGATGGLDDPTGNESSTGFPSWLVLVGGLTLIAFGMLFRRGQDGNESSRQVPEVAMIRKVRVDSRPARRVARIRKLRPPDRQNMS